MSQSNRTRIIDGIRNAFEALEDAGYAVLAIDDSGEGVSTNDAAYIGGHVSASISVISRTLDAVRRILGRGHVSAGQPTPGYVPNTGPFNAIPNNPNVEDRTIDRLN